MEGRVPPNHRVEYGPSRVLPVFITTGWFTEHGSSQAIMESSCPALSRGEDLTDRRLNVEDLI